MYSFVFRMLVVLHNCRMYLVWCYKPLLPILFYVDLFLMNAV